MPISKSDRTEFDENEFISFHNKFEKDKKEFLSEVERLVAKVKKLDGWKELGSESNNKKIKPRFLFH